MRPIYIIGNSGVDKPASGWLQSTEPVYDYEYDSIASADGDEDKEDDDTIANADKDDNDTIANADHHLADSKSTEPVDAPSQECPPQCVSLPGVHWQVQQLQSGVLDSGTVMYQWNKTVSKSDS